MREIKFRTWDKRLKLMDYNPDYNSLSEKINDSFNYSKEVIEMQFTGLKDKNKVECYFGDLVKLKDSDDIWRVMQDDFGIPTWIRERDFAVIDFKDFFSKFARDDFEVIGNIHEIYFNNKVN